MSTDITAAPAAAKLTIYAVADEGTTGPSVDTQRGIVVIAANETRARQIAADNAGDEGVYPWAFTAKVTPLGYAAKDITEGLVLRDFRAG